MLPIDRVNSIIEEVRRAEDDAARKWGFGRLRLLVGLDLRRRFDWQAEKFTRLCAEPFTDVEAVESCGAALVRGIAALDAAATEAGAQPISADVWEFEIVDDDGNVTVGALISDGRDIASVEAVQSDREIVVWSLQEVANILSDRILAPLAAAKKIYPGAKVAGVRPREPLPKGGDRLDDLWV